MKRDITLIAPACLDVIENQITLGGPVSFGGILLNVLKANFNAVVICGKKFLFERYLKENVKNCIFIKKKNNNVSQFKFIKELRVKEVLEESGKISINEIPNSVYSSKYIILANSSTNFSVSFMKSLAKKTKATLCIDPYSNDDGIFTKKQKQEFKEILKIFQIIKLSLGEAEGLFNCKGVKNVVSHLKKFDNLFLISLDKNGTHVFQKGKYNKTIKTLKVKVNKGIGSGDYLLCGFVYGLSKSFSVEKSVLFGNVCASSSIDTTGGEGVKSKSLILKYFNKMQKSSSRLA